MSVKNNSFHSIACYTEHMKTWTIDHEWTEGERSAF